MLDIDLHLSTGYKTPTTAREMQNIIIGFCVSKVVNSKLVSI